MNIHNFPRHYTLHPTRKSLINNGFGVIKRAIHRTMLKVIAHKAVPDRPARSEPRVRKRRPKIYPLITKPRHELRNMKANCLNH
ncbi:hypothetical protein [Nostoc sp. UIC 10630]|uniref:hypothetical protein n=1 Tax=Nostoc sp. UIC 10630 TaxID=2100146 RepID=UPI0013D5504A|nr:hypothetical protein [Nostoc sp. UIC 10630]NEU83647.1 hypothetical protein [Nostoc sp. UIC 10630]